MLKRNIFIGLPVLLIVLLISCKKYADKPGATDPRLDRPYCNDPEAVNYNWDFPGKPDNSICIYPSQAFVGEYDYYDSVYDANNTLIKELTFPLRIVANSNFKVELDGFCVSRKPVFSAGRQLRADGDTTVFNGQLLCRDEDTLSGYFYKEVLSDTAAVLFNLTVVSDTDITIHRGRAIRR